MGQPVSFYFPVLVLPPAWLFFFSFFRVTGGFVQIFLQTYPWTCSPSSALYSLFDSLIRALPNCLGAIVVAAPGFPVLPPGPTAYVRFRIAFQYPS